MTTHQRNAEQVWTQHPQGAHVAVDADKLLHDGIRAYEAHQWAECEAAFSQLRDLPAYTALACYGIGMARMGIADWATAQRYLHYALERDPSYADAAYQLGRLNESLRSATAARPFYERALAIDPGHSAARARLAQYGSPAQERQPDPARNRAPYAATGGATQYSVLEFLLQDGSALSKQAAELIGALHIERLAYFSVYLGRVAAGTALVAGITALLGAIPGLPPAPAWQVLWLAWLCVTAVAYARVKATSYRLANGRLRVAKGLLSRRTDTYDLWLVHDLVLHRTPFNRLTGDGTLILHYANPASRRRGGRDFVTIRGLARGRELASTYERLQNLKFVLRANPAVKGIIQ
jgi:tetratricopeptide (TPR) repeat protein